MGKAPVLDSQPPGLPLEQGVCFVLLVIPVLPAREREEFTKKSREIIGIIK